MQEIYTSDQVAKILQIHPQTVLKFIRDGKLKASKVGRGYRVKAQAIEEFLEETSRPEKSSEKTEVSRPKETLKKAVEETLRVNIASKPPSVEHKKDDDSHFPLEGIHYTIK